MQEPIKRILVGLGTSRTAESVTAHAIEIAKPRGAELVGLAVTDPVRLEWTGPRPMGVGVEEKTAELRKSRYERAQADIAAARETFSARCRSAGVAHRVDEETGDPFDVAEDLVRYHDMCVFGLRGLFEHDVVPEPVDALERLVSAGVRPVLAGTRAKGSRGLAGSNWPSGTTRTKSSGCGARPRRWPPMVPAN